MLSDELGNKSISITVKSAKMSMRVIKRVIKAYLDHSKNVKDQPKQGKQSLKELNRQNNALQDIPISSQDLKRFRYELRSYGVDYAIKKDLTQPDTYRIYFKGKDIAQIENALKNHMAKQFGKDKKPSVKERMDQAIEKYTSQKFEQQKDKTKVRSKEELL